MTMNGLRSVCLGLGLAMSAAVMADGIRSPAPEGASLYFIAPADGAVVSGPFTVKFGLKGMGVAPAGVDAPNTGHHHLLINLEEAVNPEVPLPATDQVRHFGGGQTETRLNLPVGTYRLQLMLGNHLHVPHDPPVMSEVITVTVAEQP
jgi:hypothetical protein